MIVEVKKKHIKNGKPEDCHLCPVALAIKDKLKIKQVENVEVAGHEIIYIYKDEQEDTWQDDYEYKCPRSVRRFVKKFDEGKDVKPFKFILKQKQ
jgi:hypothetical protein